MNPAKYPTTSRGALSATAGRTPRTAPGPAAPCTTPTATATGALGVRRRRHRGTRGRGSGSDTDDARVGRGGAGSLRARVRVRLPALLRVRDAVRRHASGGGGPRGTRADEGRGGFFLLVVRRGVARVVVVPAVVALVPRSARAVQAQRDHQKADDGAHPAVHAAHEPRVRLLLQREHGDEDDDEPDAVPRAPAHAEPERAPTRVPARQRRHRADVIRPGHDVKRAHGQAPAHGRGERRGVEHRAERRAEANDDHHRRGRRRLSLGSGVMMVVNDELAGCSATCFQTFVAFVSSFPLASFITKVTFALRVSPPPPDLLPGVRGSSAPLR